jgi:hypothetical protein
MGADWACMSVALPVRSQGGKLPLLKTIHVPVTALRCQARTR